MDGQSQFRPSDVEPTTVPIVIVGAGPVGLSLGLTLAHQGIESLILEKNEALDPYSRAILIPTRTLDIFDSWNLTAAAKERGIFNSRLQAYGAESGKVAITIDFTGLEDASPNAGFLFLPQDRTTDLLLNAALSTGMCKVIFGTAVSGFSQDTRGVTVEAVSGGSARRFRCQYVIGCDGAHSLVREMLDLPLAGKTYQARVLIADVSFSQHDAEDRAQSQGTAGVAPLRRDEVARCRDSRSKRGR